MRTLKEEGGVLLPRRAAGGRGCKLVLLPLTAQVGGKQDFEVTQGVCSLMFRHRSPS